MSDESKPRNMPRESKLWDFFTNLVKMPRWQRTVLAVSVLLAGAGTAGHVAGFLSDRRAAATTQPSTPQGATLATTDSPEESQAKPPALQRYSPAMAKAGFGCIAGFILGWIARLFFKTVALITTLGVALFAGLSYFKIDTSGVQKKYESAMTWVGDQGDRLYDTAKDHLPGSTSLLGMFMGFRRKKVK